MKTINKANFLKGFNPIMKALKITHPTLRWFGKIIKIINQRSSGWIELTYLINRLTI